jgi:hypothetical protein
MKAMKFDAPGGLNCSQSHRMPDPGIPGAGETRVRLHASSLNHHASVGSRFVDVHTVEPVAQTLPDRREILDQ